MMIHIVISAFNKTFSNRDILQVYLALPFSHFHQNVALIERHDIFLLRDDITDSRLCVYLCVCVCVCTISADYTCISDRC